MYSATTLGTVFLLFVIFLQPSFSTPVLPEAPSDGKQPDKYAKEAADALDSTLLFLKDGLDSLIKDSSKLTDIFSHMSESFKKYAPVDDAETRKTRSHPHEVLREQSLLANKTFHDNFLKEK